MGLENYRDQVKDLGSSVENSFSRSRADSLKSALDNVMPFVLLLIAFVVIFQFFLTVTPRMDVWITRANWALIIYFSTRLVVSYRLSRDSERFLQTHWLDILLVIPIFSVLQEVRLARLAPTVAELPVFEKGILGFTQMKSTTQAAAKMTRISRIIKRSI